MKTNTTDSTNSFTTAPLVGHVVAFCCNQALLVVLIAALITIVAATYVVNHIAIDTDSGKLISSDLPWRQRDAQFDADFPQSVDQILVVIDAVTPELAERATASLAERLSARPDLFRTVRRPDGGAFFDRNGLLFRSVDDVANITGEMITAQPMLGFLESDPSLRGLMNALSTALLGVKEGETSLDDLAQPMATLSATLQGVVAGHLVPMSWRSLLSGKPDDSRELRRFIIAQPVLDYSALAPGAAASAEIRASAKALGLDLDHGIRVRLTGPIALADEEFATVADGAALNSALTAIAIIVILWLALRSPKIIFSVLVTLAVGLVCTAWFGLAIVGPLNIISVTFAVLFVGLGVDFGIQFCIKFRTESAAGLGLKDALVAAGSSIGRPLALAAASTGAGFFAFLPTDYRGVSELGTIAGAGMFIAFALSITLLPALIALLAPREIETEIGYRFFAPLDHFIKTRHRIILGIGVLLGVISAVLLPSLKFDFNPINLRSPKVESVATLFDLMKDPNTTPNTIDVLAPTLGDVARLQQKLAELPEVAQTISLQSFIPDMQEEKLALVADASDLLYETLNPFETKTEPTDNGIEQAISVTAHSLRAAAASASNTRGADSANRLAALLEQLSNERTFRDKATQVLIPNLKTLLEQIRLSLAAAPVTIETLPPELVSDWIGKDGRARIQVFPKGDSNDNETLRAFTQAVLTVAPDATGAPISILESSVVIVDAFKTAGIGAIFAITVLLTLVLRRVSDILLTLTPLCLAGLLSLGTCVIVGQSINFANIIALPLLFGIGVAFSIYFVLAWRSGERALLQSSLTRAILFSALTTGTAFGSLWLSAHPGTASMGKLLAISLGWTLVITLFFLPALLTEFTKVRSAPPCLKAHGRPPIASTLESKP